MPQKKDTKPVLYEMMFILDTQLGEDGIESLIETLRERVKAGGGVIEKDQPWGVRRLAYEIKKRQEGYYHVFEFRSAPDLPEILTRFIRTQIAILRHLIIKVSKARVLQEQRDAAAAARRAEKIAAEERERERHEQERIERENAAAEAAAAKAEAEQVASAESSEEETPAPVASETAAPPKAEETNPPADTPSTVTVEKDASAPEPITEEPKPVETKQEEAPQPTASAETDEDSSRT